MPKRSRNIWGIVLAALVAAAWLSLTHWPYGARTWGFRLTHRVVAVTDVKRDSEYMPYTYRDVYFVTNHREKEAAVKACAVAFGHDLTSETQFTRCHAFASAAIAKMVTNGGTNCQIASSEQGPYTDARTVKVVIAQKCSQGS